jgi:hypothetical protein
MQTLPHFTASGKEDPRQGQKLTTHGGTKYPAFSRARGTWFDHLPPFYMVGVASFHTGGGYEDLKTVYPLSRL